MSEVLFLISNLSKAAANQQLLSMGGWFWKYTTAMAYRANPLRWAAALPINQGN